MPPFSIRGAHVYLPSREQLGFFARVLDFLARLRYNTLFLEIGGGMEYARHPEINSAWRDFCQVARNYDRATDPHPETQGNELRERHPAGPVALQCSRYFPKDSTHTELAGGQWLTKDEVRWIVREAAERDIEVIPEVQSLSHAYYLCVPHPEIAERADDPWPDTYCPSNPKSYELLFDVLDEVIEVVHPRIVHIGHDELYTIRVCPRCRRHAGHELLAADITRIHGFLASRNVRTAMWGDKLMNITTRDGRRYGGVARRRRDRATGKTWVMPPTWRAADLVPKDILILDWYWSLDPRSERNFHRHGFEVIYGNLSPFGFKDWRKRASVPYVLGGEISSWCEVSPQAFGHNGICHQLFAGADMLWSGKAPDPQAVCRRMAREMPAIVDELTQQPRWLVSGKGGRVAHLDISPAASALPSPLAAKLPAPRTAHFAPLTRAGKLHRAIVLDKAHPQSLPVPVNRKLDRLLVLQATTLRDAYFRPTYYSYHRGPAELLQYQVRYADGKVGVFKAIYGEDIGPLEGRWPSGGASYGYRAVPFPLASSHTLYAQEWANPRPGVPIASITVALGPDATGEGCALVAALSGAVASL